MSFKKVFSLYVILLGAPLSAQDSLNFLTPTTNKSAVCWVYNPVFADSEKTIMEKEADLVHVEKEIATLGRSITEREEQLSKAVDDVKMIQTWLMGAVEEQLELKLTVD